MRKIIFLLIGLLIISGCSSKFGNTIDEVENLNNEIEEAMIVFCDSDSDCIPKPGCHPRECINRDYEDKFESPEVCTMLFDCSAAYEESDCLCIDNKCVNKNLENPQC